MKKKSLCNHCGQEFETFPSRARPYCSQACYHTASIRPLAERFLENISITESCWPWVGPRNSDRGYAWIFTEGSQKRPVHAVAYELWVGPIPEGMEVDHLCHNADKSCSGGVSCLHRLCVNPDHLEAVPHKINTRRGRKAFQGMCPRNHIIPPDQKRRGCLVCQRIREREKHNRKRWNRSYCPDFVLSSEPEPKK